MAKKFEIIGASLVVFDTISGDILLETPKRDSFYSYRDLRDNQIVRIFDTNGTSQSGSGLANYPLADCVDSTLTSFTESSFLAFVRDNLGFNAASGGSGAIDGEVEYRADLPIVIGDPIVGSIYIVEKNTTLFGFKTYQNGLYIRQTNTGSLSDWERMNVKTNFTDSEFSIINAADTTKKSVFDASTITTGTTRTYTYPNKNGTFAMLSDIAPSLIFNVNLDDAESSVARVVSGGRTTFTITHNLNTLDLKPEVFRLSNGRTMGWRIERTGVNEVEASRSGNVANGLFRILI
jgi:hypothetical protein